MARAAKWAIDRLAALCLLLLLAPVLALVAALVLVAEGWPILHRETRIGRFGRPFTLTKFRSMRTADGPGVAPDDDPRITRLGRALRRWRIDELPQFANVLIGDMSLVGPRPMIPAHAARVPERQLATLLSVRPGMTGASALAFIGDDAALRGRPDAEAAYLERVLPAKVAMELDYIARWRLDVDARLLLRTALQLLSRSARSRSRERVTALLNDR